MGWAAVQDIGERLEDAGCASHKTAIEIDYSKEALKLTDSARPGVLLEGSNTVRQGGDAAAGDLVAEELNAGDVEETFLGVDDQPRGREAMEDIGDVEKVLLQGRVADEPIIKVGESRVRASHHLIHELLESVSSVTHTKCHTHILKHTKWCDDGCLGDVRLVHGNLVVSLAKIHLGEELAAGQPGSKIQHFG
jgi:hypothetical protein